MPGTPSTNSVGNPVVNSLQEKQNRLLYQKVLSLSASRKSDSSQHRSQLAGRLSLTKPAQVHQHIDFGVFLPKQSIQTSIPCISNNFSRLENKNESLTPIEEEPIEEPSSTEISGVPTGDTSNQKIENVMDHISVKLEPLMSKNQTKPQDEEKPEISRKMTKYKTKKNKKDKKQKKDVISDDEFLERCIQENKEIEMKRKQDQDAENEDKSKPENKQEEKAEKTNITQEETMSPGKLPSKHESQVPKKEGDVVGLVSEKIAELEHEALFKMLTSNKLSYESLVIETVRRATTLFLDDVDSVCEKGMQPENVKNKLFDLFKKLVQIPDAGITFERCEFVQSFLFDRIQVYMIEDEKYQKVRCFTYIYLLDNIQNRRELIIPTLETFAKTLNTPEFEEKEAELLKLVLAEYDSEDLRSNTVRTNVSILIPK